MFARRVTPVALEVMLWNKWLQLWGRLETLPRGLQPVPLGDLLAAVSLLFPQPTVTGGRRLAPWHLTLVCLGHVCLGTMPGAIGRSH